MQIFKATMFALCITTFSANAFASLESEFRSILVKEVTEQVQDSSLINDIIEIRFKREFEKWKSSQTTQVVKSSDKSLNVTDAKLNYFGRQSKSIGIGSKLSVGYQSKISPDLGYHFDISGKRTSGKSQEIDSAQYQIKESHLSLGGYLDWFPFSGSFRITTGINLNRIKTSAALPGNSLALINGKQISSTNDSFDIVYRFPKITPFVGLGYQSGTEGDYGWSSFVDIGLMFGKFDAEAKTTLLGQNSVNLQDINYEIDTIRNKIFKGNYIPTALIGMKFSY